MPEMNPYSAESAIYGAKLDKSVRELLMEIDKLFDDNYLYVYRNWIDGTVVAGPDVSRHWVSIVLEYPRMQMPDPDGARRLVKLNIRIRHEMAVVETPREITCSEDVDPQTGKAKIDDLEMCYVHVDVPRHFLDNIKPSVSADILPTKDQAESPDDDMGGDFDGS